MSSFSINTQLQKIHPVFRNTGILFLVKFIFLIVFFHFLNEAVIGFSAEGGYYSAFVAQYLNYIDPWRSAILNTSAWILQLFEYPSILIPPYKLKSLVTGHSVAMVYSCIGYGVTGVWLAFVFAVQFNWKQKLIWAITGFCTLFFLNCLRVIGILLASADKELLVNSPIDHHTLFNIVAYGFVFGMIYLLIKKAEKADS